MPRALSGILLLAGLAAVAVGVGVDWLRAGGSAGFGGAQVTLVVVGLVLVASSVALRLRAVQERLRPALRYPWQTAGLVVFSAAVSLAALEVGLALLGQRPMYAAGEPDRLSLAPWWQCDDLGCRFDPRHARDASVGDAAGQPRAEVFFERARAVNAQGFRDDDDFVAPNDEPGRLKVLVLGDSFAFGFYASLGQGWVEVLETELGRERPLTLWNTGIPGAATTQEVALLEHYFPVLRPELVIATFYPTNDIDGNLYPTAGFYAVESGSLVPSYKLGPGLEPIRMNPADAYHRATGVRLRGDAGAVAAVLGRSRTGSLFLDRWWRLRPDVEWLWSPAARATPGSEAKWRRATLRTRELLAAAKALVEGRGARFLLVLIPSPRDLEGASERFRAGREIARDLAIETVELPQLVAEDYLPGDEHWNAAGHAKVGRRLADFLRDSAPD